MKQWYVLYVFLYSYYRNLIGNRYEHLAIDWGQALKEYIALHVIDVSRTNIARYNVQCNDDKGRPLIGDILASVVP